MAEDSRDKSEGRLRVDQLPLAVKRLIDVMAGVDPNFEIEDWLIKKANEDLALLDLDPTGMGIEAPVHMTPQAAGETLLAMFEKCGGAEEIENIRGGQTRKSLYKIQWN